MNTNQTMSRNQNNGATESAKYNKLAIIGFILSIISIFAFRLVVSPISIILGIVALAQIKRTNEKGRGLAIAAVIINAIIILFNVIGVILIIISRLILSKS